MAQPANTFSSYDAVGIREDLADVIYNVDPDETPFMSACSKTSARNTLHEWQTDSLRSSEENAHIEGDDTVADALTPTTRLNNRTQIFKNAIRIPGTDTGLNKAGRGREMAYQSRKMLQVHKLDIERALFLNQPKVGGDDLTARKLAGVPTWLTTNVEFESGNSGANPTGDGSDARTDDGTPVAFSQARFDSVMQSRWENGGKKDGISVYLSAFQMNKALGFVGNNNQRGTLNAKSGEVVNYMDMYMTPWGTVKWVMSRENRARDVFVLQDDMWCVATLRSTRNEPLAKTGDSERRQLVTELTLESKNEKASGAVYDNTTS